MSEQKRISDWLNLAGAKSPDKPQFPENDKFQLALGLVLEELIEAAVSGTAEQAKEFLLTAQASIKEAQDVIDSFVGSDEQSLVELRDACADMRVVMGNLIHFAGIQDQFDEDFKEVMDSNFSKFCTSEQEAQDSVDAYGTGTHPNKMGEVIECYHEKVGDYWIVKRKSDNKVLKSINFKDAELK